MTKTIAPILFCFTLMLTCNVHAQQPAYTYYSIREGLPSNDIYNCVEDKKGFLWIATENGVSKFDGKNFKNYSTVQGLPDNDVLTVELDSAGVIWVMPFQRNPAYYDEKKDRFINSTIDKELSKVDFGNVNTFNALTGGGMGFCNNKGQVFIYKNKKCTVINLLLRVKSISASRIIDLKDNHYLFVSNDSLRVFFDGKFIKQTALNRMAKQTAFVNNNLYIADSATLVKIEILPDGAIGKIVESKLPFVIRALNFTRKQIAISSSNGNVYFADTATLSFSQQAFSFNSFPRHVTEDNARNTWICTKESGIVRYQQKGILTVSNEAFLRNFNTLSFLNDKIAVGTNDGQIFLYNGPYNHKAISLNDDKSYVSWVRKTKPTKNGLVIGSEGGLFLLKNNLEKIALFDVKRNIASKDFIIVNDTILYAGNSALVSRINLNNLKLTHSLRLRVTALEAITDEHIYVGSNTGLYKWQSHETLKNFGLKNPLLSTRVSSLEYNNSDNILWVGLATDSLVAFQNDKIVAVIPLGAKLPGNIARTLYSSKKGIVWVGTNLSLGRIEYKMEGEKLVYKIAVFTTADGIAGKQINDIDERNDTIYVATTSGISIIPSTLNFAVPNIPVFITSIKIDNVDTVLSNEYMLDYEQQNITLSFATADLGSTTERIYEYRINNGDWNTTQIEKIELYQLGFGTYKVQIRAINRDGLPSSKVEVITFKIKTPLRKNPWFWALVGLVLGGIIFYFTQKTNKIKRERSVQKLLVEKKLSELELRALKAQINPHFVFNCLNSIKFLNHQKRFTETDIYLDKFSYLLRKTLDFSGLQKIALAEELAYSKNYLELEKLRLGEKLNYEIIVDKEVDATVVLVPPMLFQPYLENAIKHGIRHLTGVDGKVSIEIKQIEDSILCIISDNGVGIENARLLNAKDNPNHHSLGTTLQQRRADLYDVAVSTAYGENGIGTKITLTLQNEHCI